MKNNLEICCFTHFLHNNKIQANAQGSIMKANKLTKETVLNYGITDRKFPEFRVGDTIEVAQKIKEGEKERIQLFEGDIIKFRKNGIASTFTIRRIGANGVGVERIFPMHADIISEIRVIRHGKVRRANLKYVRERLGKAARVQEKVTSRETEDQLAA